jgi:hypothetical protein
VLRLEKPTNLPTKDHVIVWREKFSVGILSQEATQKKEDFE